ncbi:hypothetical protein QWJ34_06845 [Saccharibacillus sp. CPCC 101409]|uniref:hypothetical protein n=1 Tax=Saccharibacillus sp. CPCC 101409 TaxID=3058041 RepID=UPI002672C59B|nr:hypothetical protein [Saccharibacillus sp. CPCC 101409]MDO3409475.1 hypothetical protein [Saccharibacillus sp. CPCC 101409]
MSRKKPKKMKKWPLAVLAVSLAAGAAYTLPNGFAADKGNSNQSKIIAAGAAASTSTEAKVVAPVIAIDPKPTSASAARAALIKLARMSVSTAAASDLYSSENDLRKLHQARNESYKVVFDPKAPADRIYSASRKLEEAIDRYNKSAVKNAEVLGKILKYEKASVRNGRNEHALDEMELLELKGIKEAQAKLAADPSDKGVQAAYKHFLSSEADVHNLEPFDRAAEVAFLKRYQEHYAAETARIGSGAKEAAHLREAYETAAEAMQSAIDAEADNNELNAASVGVIESYAAFLAGLRLTDALESARALLDSPTGAEKGQYPASSIGTLKRAIDQAQASLKKEEMYEELDDAQDRLESAVRTFKASRNS